MSAIQNTDFSRIQELAGWLITTGIVLLGIRYAKQIIGFVLDELYRIFIQNHPANL